MKQKIVLSLLVTTFWIHPALSVGDLESGALLRKKKCLVCKNLIDCNNEVVVKKSNGTLVNAHAACYGKKREVCGCCPKITDHERYIMILIAGLCGAGLGHGVCLPLYCSAVDLFRVWILGCQR